MRAPQAHRLKRNGVSGGAPATTTRRRRDRLKGHPQERQHSAANGGTRDRVPPARRSLFLREGSLPEAETPGSGSAARRARPAQPDAPAKFCPCFGLSCTHSTSRHRDTSVHHPDRQSLNAVPSLCSRDRVRQEKIPEILQCL